jgi:hypothetical protein
MNQTALAKTRRPPREPSVKRVLVDAALAQEILAKNRDNRHINRAFVRELANAMRTGEYRETGDTIRRAPDGRLLDGQHRLEAVVEADAEVWMLLVDDVDPSAQDVMDRGRRRTLGDVLTIRGNTQGNTLAAALGWLWSLNKLAHGSQANVRNAGPSFRLTVPEMLKLLDETPGLENSLRIATSVKNAPFRYPPSLGVALHYQMSQINPEAADEFFAGLATGAELPKGDPVYVLREQLTRAGQQRIQRPHVDYAAWTVYSWNAWRQNRSLTRLMYRPGTEFPSLERA